MHIVGTAGHVDHGKSTLIQALTGTDPDRLKEEIEREMTIELGFASMQLPGGESIGIVDVPGHIDFISNMLSGVGSIDAVLLVIAADEGVSAQTREHLAILDLLGIEKGLAVMTKIDLVDDAEWLDLVEMEIHEVLQGTSLQKAPLVRVSSVLGTGLDELKKSLAELLDSTPPKKNLGKPRLPVDRVFTLQGFGTVVTGTLLDGSFAIGEEVIVLPQGIPARIRGIQNHSHKLQKIEPGFRAALNLSGINKELIHRGDIIVHAGDYETTRMIDLRLRALANLPAPLRHNQPCNLYIGASEVQGQIRLLGTEALKAGQEAYLQIRLKEPIVAARADRVILRQASPSLTLGGGEVLDAHPSRRYKRFDEGTLEHLANLAENSSSRAVLDLLNNSLPLKAQKIASQLHLSEEELKQILPSLNQAGEALLLKETSWEEQVWQGTSAFIRTREEMLGALQAFHQANPMKAGLPREELRGALQQSKEVFELLLQKLREEGLVRDSGRLVAAQTHQVCLSEAQKSKAMPFMERFERSPYGPPDQKELEESLGAEIIEGLLGSGQLVRVSAEILFSPQAYEAMKNWVQTKIQAQGSLALSEFRDQFSTSRKFAAAFLEHLDTIGLTMRKGDVRVLRIVK
ncbi:MAG: selenocysteine-specific translation elongation factor [Anaerolineaceae bacterium]|nr:selenocysteine-specific translation elongation factor [Anaerolineaceae bacterium]